MDSTGRGDNGAASGREPLAICGSAIILPGDIDTPQHFFDIVHDKIQCRQDLVSNGRVPISGINHGDDSNTRKLKARHHNLFGNDCKYLWHRLQALTALGGSEL